MDAKAEFKVQEKERSFLARRTIINVNGKMITTPCYGAIIKSNADLDGVFEAYNHLTETKVMFASANFLSKINNLAIQGDQKSDLFRRYLHLKQNNLFFVDPTAKGFLLNADASIDDLTPESWSTARTNTKTLMNFITSSSEKQFKLDGDSIISPSPLIKSDSPNYLLDLWFDVVKTTGTYAKIRFGRSSSILLNLHFNVFRNSKRLNEIVAMLNNEDKEREIADVKSIFLRVKDPRFETDTGAITRYKNFVSSLALYAKNTERALFVYNTDSLGLASINLGADGFIEPQNGQLSEFPGRSPEKHGSHYDSIGLRHKPFLDVDETYQNNDGVMSHDCEYCVKYNGLPTLKDASLSEWWIDKRAHLLVCRNHEIQEAITEIQQNTISKGMLDKFQRSSVKNYIDALP